MKPGKDYIGIGCGAVIKNPEGKILLMKRGPLSKTEPGTWCIPGGAVDFGERMSAAAVREVKEELGLEVEVVRQYGCADHIISSEQQHWVSTIFLCEIAKGEPAILEPGKCDEIGWFSFEEMDNLPLGVIMKENLKIIRADE